MTLGAKPGDVLRLVLGQGLRLAVMGAAIGIIGAFMLTRLLTNLLYAVKPTDPLTFFVVLLVLICAAMLAVTFPPVARLAPILWSLYDMNKFAA